MSDFNGTFDPNQLAADKNCCKGAIFYRRSLPDPALTDAKLQETHGQLGSLAYNVRVVHKRTGRITRIFDARWQDGNMCSKSVSLLLRNPFG